MHKQPTLLLFLICVFLTANAQQGPITLQVGTPVERTLKPGQTQEFTLNLEENNLAQFVVEQRGIERRRTNANNSTSSSPTAKQTTETLHARDRLSASGSPIRINAVTLS